MNSLFKQIIRIMMIPLIMVQAGCSQDETLTGENAGLPLQIRVTAGSFASGAPETRTTTDANHVTSFTDGDRIGITVVNSSGAIVQDNVPYVYNAAADCFVAASVNVCELAGATYLAYYPYDAAMDGKKTEAEIIDAFTPRNDQSAYGDYMASDLLTGIGVVSSNGTTLNIPFAHALSMLEISLPLKQKFNILENGSPSADYEGNVINPELDIKIAGSFIKPYFDEANRVYRCLVAPGDNIAVDGSYKICTKTITWSETPAMTAGTYKRLKIISETVITVTPSTSFEEGDYYPMADEPACAIGVVFQVSNGGKNGKIIALDESPILLQYSLSGDWYSSSYPDGLDNQKDLESYSYDWSDVPAFEYCHNYNVAFTDWYLPSVDEWKDISDNLSTINDQIIPPYTDKITGSYWTSCEIEENDYYPFYFDFSVGKEEKDSSKASYHKVRAARTF